MLLQGHSRKIRPTIRQRGRKRSHLLQGHSRKYRLAIHQLRRKRAHLLQGHSRKYRLAIHQLRRKMHLHLSSVDVDALKPARIYNVQHAMVSLQLGVPTLAIVATLLCMDFVGSALAWTACGNLAAASLACNYTGYGKVRMPMGRPSSLTMGRVASNGGGQADVASDPRALPVSPGDASVSKARRLQSLDVQGTLSHCTYVQRQRQSKKQRQATAKAKAKVRRVPKY